MPDRDLIPSGRSLDSAPPAASGLDGVLTRARTRRRAKLGALGGASTAVLIVAAVLVGGNGGVDALRLTNPAHQPGGTSRPSAGPTSTGRTVAEGTQAAKAGGPAGPSVSTVMATPPASTTTTPDPAVSASAAPGSAQGLEVGPDHSVTSYDATRGCVGDGPAPGQGWCSYYDGATAGRSGQQVELAASICRVTGQGDGELTASSGEQADFYIASNGLEAWSWSHGRQFATAGTTLKVAAGTCVRWHVTWDVVDNAGQPLAPGSYDFTARPAVRAAGEVYVGQNTNKLTFTVS